MERFLDYIRETYRPLSVIVYGSYADGSRRESSDFDALAIVREGEALHDTSVVDGVRMDLWVYPVSMLGDTLDPEEVLQILDGILAFDTDGIGAALQNRVAQYISELPPKSEDEVREALSWCRKMLARAEDRDAEGLYRWHWLLTDSLEIACDALHRRYLGPKKSLRWLQGEYPALYELYAAALRSFDVAIMHAFLEQLGRYTVEGSAEEA